MPLLSSPNVRLVGNVPESAAIAGCFARSAPYFYGSSLDSVSVFDTSDPLHPRLTGTLDNLTFENEAMNCGERRHGRTTQRFVLIGVDLHQASSGDLQHVNTGDGQELVVVDVTDPAAPRIRARMPASTGTHTVACVDDTDCRYAYSSGDDGRDGTGEFSIFDLTDLDRPREVDSDPSTPAVDPFPSPTAGHKWNFDDAGFGTQTGYDGSGMFDVRDPLHPLLVTTTGTAGQGTDPAYPGYNDFIHHNSFRPHADAFVPHAEPSYASGNVLLVTEEDYMQTDCALADLGSFPVPQYAFCSAHWFDFHPSGIVAVGYYGGGLQLVDARDPRDLEPYGHATWGLSEVWDAYWVPRYNKRDVATDDRTNIVYTVDLARGLDVYTVDLPDASGGSDGSGQEQPEEPGLPVPTLFAAVAGVLGAGG